MFNFKLIFGNKYHKNQRRLEEMQAEPASAETEKNSAEASCCPDKENEKNGSKE